MAAHGAVYIPVFSSATASHTTRARAPAGNAGVRGDHAHVPPCSTTNTRHAHAKQSARWMPAGRPGGSGTQHAGALSGSTGRSTGSHAGGGELRPASEEMRDPPRAPCRPAGAPASTGLGSLPPPSVLVVRPVRDRSAIASRLDETSSTMALRPGRLCWLCWPLASNQRLLATPAVCGTLRCDRGAGRRHGTASAAPPSTALFAHVPALAARVITWDSLWFALVDERAALFSGATHTEVSPGLFPFQQAALRCARRWRAAFRHPVADGKTASGAPPARLRRRDGSAKCASGA